jgi:serine/threonine protein kinase
MKTDPDIPATETAASPAAPDSPAKTATGQAPQLGTNPQKLPSVTLAQTPAAGHPQSTLPTGSGTAPRAPGYRIVRELGRGTFGEVWLAEDESTGVRVAIKFLVISLGEQWQLLQAEVKQLAALHDDPGIVQLMSFDPAAPRPYYVMAYAEGGSLAQRLREGPLPLNEALPMFRRIAEAMAYVHAKGIRHCDLKPGNILLDKRGRPRVADFGQAHLASDISPALGTFFYMAPEQADLLAQTPDARWDVYGLGAVFYAMLTGDPPYENSSLRQELAKTERLPHRLDLYRAAMQRARPLTAHRQVMGMDKQLAAIIDRCLAVDPARRYRTAEAIVAALDQRQRRRRQRTIVYAGLVVPILLLLLLGGLGWRQASAALDASEQNLEKQAMKSYANSARLAAAKVKDTVEHYIKGLATAAHDPALKAALKAPSLHDDPRSSNAGIKKILEQFEKDNRPPLNLADPVFYRLVLDNTGCLVGVLHRGGIFDQKYVGCNFGWRGYFNGREDDAQAMDDFLKWKQERDAANGALPPFQWQGKKFRPIEKMTHISDPFKSADGKRSISLSAPVKDENDGTVLGVLLVALDLDALGRWLTDIDFADDGFPVMINEDTHVLEHRSKQIDWGKNSKTPKKYGDDCPLYWEIVQGTSSEIRKGGAARFRDPLLHEDYLAGFVRIEFKEPQSSQILDQKWGLLVQVKYDSVMQPANSLKNDMVRWGATMLAVALCIIVAMWLGLLWLLRREERLAHP